MGREVFALATQQNTANAMKEVGIKNTFNITDFLNQVKDGKIECVKVVRTARRIMDGYVYTRNNYK